MQGAVITDIDVAVPLKHKTAEDHDIFPDMSAAITQEIFIV
jgi:hypothetical protein